MDETKTAQGQVKWFDARRGYGFITTSQGEDIFVHWTAIESDGYKALKQGDHVEFVIESDDKGRTIAHQVKKSA